MNPVVIEIPAANLHLIQLRNSATIKRKSIGLGPNIIKGMMNRQIGTDPKPLNNEFFASNLFIQCIRDVGSLVLPRPSLVKRFNHTGEILGTTSIGDPNITLRFWTTNRKPVKVRTNQACHKFIFEWLPYTNRLIVTAGQYGLGVNVGCISVTDLENQKNRDVLKSDFLSLVHVDHPYPFTVHPENPNNIYASNFNDTRILSIDIRDFSTSTVIKKPEVYPVISLAMNPRKPYEMAVAGSTQHLYIYDIRKTSEPQLRMTPVLNAKEIHKIEYNYNGTELLTTVITSTSYRLCLIVKETTKPSPCLRVARKEGEDLYSAKYFGSRSQYIVYTHVKYTGAENMCLWSTANRRVVRTFPVGGPIATSKTRAILAVGNRAISFWGI